MTSYCQRAAHRPESKQGNSCEVGGERTRPSSVSEHDTRCFVEVSNLHGELILETGLSTLPGQKTNFEQHRLNAVTFSNATITRYITAWTSFILPRLLSIQFKSKTSNKTNTVLSGYKQQFDKRNENQNRFSKTKTDFPTKSRPSFHLSP